MSKSKISYQLQMIGPHSGLYNMRPVTTRKELQQDIIGIGLDKNHSDAVVMSVIITNSQDVRYMEKLHLGTLRNVRDMPFIREWYNIEKELVVLEEILYADITKNA